MQQRERLRYKLIIFGLKHQETLYETKSERGFPIGQSH